MEEPPAPTCLLGFGSHTILPTLRCRRKGCIAHIKRLCRSMKGEYARGLFLYRPLRSIEADLERYAEWFNGERPHQGLGDLTPDEVHAGRRRRPRVLPERVALHVRYLGHYRALPVLRLRRAA